MRTKKKRRTENVGVGRKRKSNAKGQDTTKTTTKRNTDAMPMEATRVHLRPMTSTSHAEARLPGKLDTATRKLDRYRDSSSIPCACVRPRWCGKKEKKKKKRAENSTQGVPCKCCRLTRLFLHQLGRPQQQAVPAKGQEEPDHREHGKVPDEELPGSPVSQDREKPGEEKEKGGSGAQKKLPAKKKRRKKKTVPDDLFRLRVPSLAPSSEGWCASPC